MGLEQQNVDFKNGILQYPNLLFLYLRNINLWYEERKSIYGKLWTDSDRLANSKPSILLQLANGLLDM